MNVSNEYNILSSKCDSYGVDSYAVLGVFRYGTMGVYLSLAYILVLLYRYTFGAD